MKPQNLFFYTSTIYTKLPLFKRLVWKSNPLYRFCRSITLHEFTGLILDPRTSLELATFCLQSNCSTHLSYPGIYVSLHIYHTYFVFCYVLTVKRYQKPACLGDRARTCIELLTTSPVQEESASIAFTPRNKKSRNLL